MAIDVYGRTEREFNAMMRRTRIETSGDDVFDEEIASQWKQYRVRERDFADVYDQSDITHDLTVTRGIRERFEDKETPEAYGLHMAFMEGVNKYNWLGENAEVVYASEYDDIRRGVDCVVCFSRDGMPSLKIGIDVTSSDDVMVLRDKLQKQLKNIQDYRNLPEIKYFQYEDRVPETPEEQEPKGKIRLPVVTLGVDRAHARELITRFSQLAQSSGEDRKEFNAKIEHAPTQHHLIKECVAQLGIQLNEAIHDYAIKQPEDCPEAINKLIAWMEDWEEFEAPGHIPEEYIDTLKEIIASRQFRELHSRTDNTIQELADALVYMAELQKEKGVSNDADANRDYTAAYLSKPTRASSVG